MKLFKITGLALTAAIALSLCACSPKAGSVPEEEKIMPESGMEQSETPGFLDAGRFEGVDGGYANRFWEVTIPYGCNGEIDTALSYTLKENEAFYLRSYLFGAKGRPGSGEGFAKLVPAFARGGEEFEEPGITVKLDYYYENASAFLEEKGNGIKKIREDLYYEAAGESGSTDNTDNMYKLVQGEASDKMEDYLVVTLYCFPEEFGTMSPEEIEEMLVQASDCITGDTGAPYLQDLLCTLNFGGFQLRDLWKIAWFQREFSQEGKEISRTVELSEGEKDLKDIDAIYVEEMLPGASGTSEENYEGQVSPISLFGKDYQYQEEERILKWSENGVTFRIRLQEPEIWKDPKGALTILAERYLKPLDQIS